MLNTVESPTPLIQYTDIQRSQLSISEVARRLGIQNAHCWKKRGVPRDATTQRQLRNILFKPALFISKCEGGYKNTALANWNTDFHNLVEEFGAPSLGNKDGSYFIRCAGTQRNNVDTADKAYVLILDGDSRIGEDGEILPGAPNPVLVHETLKSFDIQHLIYTSHSNDKGLPKYRVVIPCEYSPEQVPILLDYLFNKLHEANIMLAPVPENRAWSQPWYFPRVPDEQRKALFEFYAYEGALLDVDGIDSQWQQVQPEPAEPKPLILKPSVNTAIDQRNPIEAFNQSYSVQGILFRNGYIKKGAKFLRPDSTSKIPAVQLCLNCTDGIERIYSHGGDALNDGHAHDAFDCYRILECDGDLNTALGWSPDITKHNQRLYIQEQAKLKPKQTSKPKQLSPIIENNPEQLNQPISLIKQSTINKLLNKVVRVDFKAVCLKLGWTLVHNQDGTEKPPLQKHYKVSIIDQQGQLRDALAKYQVMLDNELYKAIKALRETQAWRLDSL